MHINGHPTGQAISKSILFLSEKEWNWIEECRAQDYDGASAMNGSSPGDASAIKKQKPFTEYTQFRKHILTH